MTIKEYPKSYTIEKIENITEDLLEKRKDIGETSYGGILYKGETLYTTQFEHNLTDMCKEMCEQCILEYTQNQIKKIDYPEEIFIETLEKKVMSNDILTEIEKPLNGAERQIKEKIGMRYEPEGYFMPPENGYFNKNEEFRENAIRLNHLQNEVRNPTTSRVFKLYGEPSKKDIERFRKGSISNWKLARATQNRCGITISNLAITLLRWIE